MTDYYRLETAYRMRSTIAVHNKKEVIGIVFYNRKAHSYHVYDPRFELIIAEFPDLAGFAAYKRQKQHKHISFEVVVRKLKEIRT